MAKWIDGRKYRTFGDLDDEDELEAEPDDIRVYADMIDRMTPQELSEHERALDVVRHFEHLEREGLI